MTFKLIPVKAGAVLTKNALTLSAASSSLGELDAASIQFPLIVIPILPEIYLFKYCASAKAIN